MTSAATFNLVTSEFKLAARLTPWDTDCFGFVVGQIDVLECFTPAADVQMLQPFFQWVDQSAIRLVSCRLPHYRLAESMLLEACGFRFVETVLHPDLDLPDSRYQDQFGLTIEPATPDDISTLEAIAAHAFIHGRIHTDPRLGSTLGDRRYARWVSNCLNQSRQRLLKISNEEGLVVSVFITEARLDQSIYWHLTAISPEYQSQGYGSRVWRAMLAQHAHDGMRSVRTTITAGNVPALNLYAKLGFRFLPPEMTFHWLLESER